MKRHLTNARDALSQMTQLPAASQLAGDARTQVSQLISNFNELITTNVDWRAAYAKVQTNLTALVGEQGANEPPAAPAAGAAGAVGTSGTASLDPAIRAKLIEFRTHLAEFEKAAGGGTPSAAAPAAQPEPSAAASASPAPSASPSSNPSAASSAATTATAATPASATTASPAATTGTTTPATAGTSGTGTPAPATSEQASKPSTSGRDAAQAAEGHSEAMKHIEAIEAILNGARATSPTGTSGSTATKPGTLDHAQIEQIKSHLAQLRIELEKSKR